MSSPPQTPPLLSHSPNVTPCTSADRTPSRSLNVLPSPETERKPARTSSLKRKRDETHVRRPANPFILFACEYRKRKAEKKNNRELSKEAGILWKIMSDKEKMVWRERAAAVKEKHAEDHPGYRYQPRRRETPCHPKRPCDGQNQAGAAVFTLPPTPASIPRKSAVGATRTARKYHSIKDDEDAILYPSILRSPTLYPTKSLVKARNLTKLLAVHTPHVASELTLPPLSLPRLVSSTAPGAGPSSATIQPLFCTSNDNGSYVAQPWTNFPQQIDGQRWSNMSLLFPDPAVWNQGIHLSPKLMRGMGDNETDTRTPMGGNEKAAFVSHFGEPTFAGPYGAISNGLTPHFNSFLDDSVPANGK